MKIIDKTPFISETGEISLIDRIQAMLKFGYNWFKQLDAQQAIINRIGKHLGGKYILLRNVTLPRSDIMIPIIILGPTGIFVLNVIHLRGVYLAKGDTWGTLEGERIKPASINMLARTARLGRALQVYLKKQGHEIEEIEPVLVAADPGLHVDSIRPLVRVVLSDAVDRFAATIPQGRPVLSAAAVIDLAERIQIPRSKDGSAPKPAEQAPPPADDFFAFNGESSYTADTPEEGESQVPIWDPNAGEFGFQDANAPTQPEPEPAYDSEMSYFDEPAQPAQPPIRRRKKPRGLFGMTTQQVALLGCMGVFQICLIVGFVAYLIYSNQAPLP